MMTVKLFNKFNIEKPSLMEDRDQYKCYNTLQTNKAILPNCKAFYVSKK